MRLWLTISLLLLSLWLGAQQRIPYKRPAYDFIAYDSSQLVLPGSSVYFDNFYRKLSRLIFEGDGKVKIMHIGASHIQAGMWSWAVRSGFESLAPSVQGAPGFLFPFSIANSNHPYYYKSWVTGNWDYQRITDKEVKYPLGLGGITAIGSDTVAEVHFVFNPAAAISYRKFNMVTVFHNADDDSYRILLLPESNVLRQYTDVNAGKTVFILKQASDSLNIRFEKIDDSNSEYYFYGALTSNNLPAVEYYTIGINGANTASYLKAGLFSQQLCSFDPDLVILSIGVNDAAGNAFAEERYTNNYAALIQTIREQYPEVAILLTTNTDFYNYRAGHNPYAASVKTSMMTNAEKYGAAVWDAHTAMGGDRSINQWRSNGLAQKDRIHLTQEGYSILGSMLFEAILRDYEKFLVKQSEN